MSQSDYFALQKAKCVISNHSVKGSLGRNYKFWKNLGTYEYILDIIKNGYSIPFIQLPPTLSFQNNRSAKNNDEFVTGQIQDLLSSCRIIKVPFQRHVVSPLSVAENKTKKRLILDLSILNNYVNKQKI